MSTITEPILLDKTGNAIKDAILRVASAIGGGNGVIYGFHVDENQSNPSNAVTYLKDSVGMTPAKMDYVNDKFNFGSWRDAFFMPRPCMLKYNGLVDYYLSENNLALKEDGTPSDIANVNYEGNAMAEWGQNGKKIWYKIIADADGNGWTAYIADHQVDSTYIAPSFINNQNVMVDHFYTPIYNGSLDENNRLRSLSGQIIMDSKNAAQEIEYAKNNNIGNDVLWYTETFADSILINLLLILMGKSLDTQSVFGQGNTTGGQSSVQGKTTGTLNDKGMFYGSTSTTQQMKVFFMENYWGHQWRRIAGLMVSANRYYYKLTYGTADGSTLNAYGTSVSGMLDGGEPPTANGYQKKNKVVGNAILPIDTSGSSTTYYCDYYWINGSTNYAIRGGLADGGADGGAFCLLLVGSVGHAVWNIGAAISCKPLAR